MSITRFNKTGSKFINVPGNVNDFKCLKTKEAYEKYGNTSVRILSVFISKTGYKYPMCITENEFIMLPTYLEDSVTDIIGDPDTVEDINNGICGVKFTTWKDKQDKLHYGAEFVEL